MSHDWLRPVQTAPPGRSWDTHSNPSGGTSRDAGDPVRDIDGRLCAISVAVGHRSSTEFGRKQLLDEAAELMARRQAATTAARSRPRSGLMPAFVAPPELPDELED